MLSLTKDMEAKDKRDREPPGKLSFLGNFAYIMTQLITKHERRVKKLAAHRRLPQIMTFLRASVRTWVRHLPQLGALWLKSTGCWCPRLLDCCSPAEGL